MRRFLSSKTSSLTRRLREKRDVSETLFWKINQIYLTNALVTNNIVEFFIERKGDPTNIQTLYTAAHKFSKKEV